LEGVNLSGSWKLLSEAELSLLKILLVSETFQAGIFLGSELDILLILFVKFKRYFL